MCGRTEGYVYDNLSPWNGTHVGCFTHDKKVTGSSKRYADTKHLFNRWKAANWGANAGATFDDDGVMTVYAQPVIGTKTKKDGAWVICSIPAVH